MERICIHRYSRTSKKARVKEDIERYSVIRTVAAVERCDVAILVIDAEEGITEQDARSWNCLRTWKGMIICGYKWDLIEKNDKTIYKFTNQVESLILYVICRTCFHLC